jgi:hypothetical protein
MHEYQTSLADLAHRIAELEEALRVSHKRYSRMTHPLLDEDRLRIKDPFLRQAGETSNSPTSSVAGTRDDTDPDELVESFDNLSVSGLGRSNYIGPAAWSSVSALSCLARSPLLNITVYSS